MNARGGLGAPGEPESPAPPLRARSPRRPVRRAFAWATYHLRFLIVPAWVAVAVAASLSGPSLAEAGKSSSLESFVPDDSPAVQAEIRSLELFPFPLASRTVVVHRDPDGLSLPEQASALTGALRLLGDEGPELAGLEGALPITNALGVLPFAREESTTTVTYLFFSADQNVREQFDLAHAYIHRYIRPEADAGQFVGVTGVAPALLFQGTTISERLPWVELATVVLVGLVVGIHFRSVVAPAITLASAGVAYLLTDRLVAWVSTRAGLPVPAELEPLIVVLLLGIVTDYSIFMMSGARQELASGRRRADALKGSTRLNAPTILAAGVAVAAGAAVLLVARLDLFRALGPGLALTVLVGLAVSVTLVPALLGIFGTLAFWPGTRRRSGVRRPGGDVDAARSTWRHRLDRILTLRGVGALVTVVVVGGLVALGLSLREARLGIPLVTGLPPETEPRAAADQAARGFSPGIVSPSVLLIEQDGAAARRREIDRLAKALEREPGVAGVLAPPPQAADPLRVFVAENGDAARLVIVLDAEPLGARAIAITERLRQRLPSLLARVGLRGAAATLIGDTAVSAEVVDQTVQDLGRIALAAIVLHLVILMVFLRAVVAAVYLLVADVVALAGALGLTWVLAAEVMGYSQFSFYVPFAAAVLLVSLGSDYNIFVVGRIWEEARHRPLREAVIEAAPGSSRAIAAAGIALALSFATLAIIPLAPFREFALAMVLGIAVDAFLVRSVLVPALMGLFGRSSAWPGRRLRPAEPAG